MMSLTIICTIKAIAASAVPRALERFVPAKTGELVAGGGEAMLPERVRCIDLRDNRRMGMPADFREAKNHA